jgi:hypothetical protein
LLFIMRISREAWIHYPSASEPTGRIDLACRVPLERESILLKSAMLAPRFHFPDALHFPTAFLTARFFAHTLHVIDQRNIF